MVGHNLMSAAAPIGAAGAGRIVRVARFRAVVSPGRAAGSARPHCARASQLSRPSGGRHIGPAMVYGSKLCAVIVRPHFVLPLQGSGFDVPVAARNNFTGGWASSEPAGTAIVADAIYREIVRYRTVVNVGEVPRADIGHRPVIKEGPTPPFPTYKAHPWVTEAIIDAAVEAHVGAPVTRMPDECGATPAPVTRRP
jgi:hypothetical protein